MPQMLPIPRVPSPRSILEIIGEDLAQILHQLFGWEGAERVPILCLMPPARSELRGLGFDADGEPLSMDFVNPPKVWILTLTWWKYAGAPALSPRQQQILA